MRSYPNSRIVFCGNRSIAHDSLKMMRDEFDIRPVGLIVSESAGATHQDEIRSACDNLTAAEVFSSSDLRTVSFVSDLGALLPDLIVSVHFPHLIPSSVLRVPTNGAVNLHPSFLPFNRGWHTASWAILDGTPAGATLHYMEEELDSGNILFQQSVETLPTDTAHALYQRILSTEVGVLREGLPRALAGHPGWRPEVAGTAHRKGDLLAESVRDLDQYASADAARIIDVIRALSTNSVDEAAYFETDGNRYRVRIEIVESPHPTE